MTLKLFSLVMAGGKGTRLWPESTASRPKQYMKLFGHRSLIEETLMRFDGLVPVERRFIVTTKEQHKLAQKLTEYLVSSHGYILEPSGRNTAPCILLSLAHLLQNGAKKEDVVVIVPSDHVILNHQAFRKTLLFATKMADEQKKIITIGVNPTFPQTGFGYIQKGSLLKAESDLNLFDVNGFKEKPKFDVAKEYVASGNYVWNAGMFVAPIGVLLSEFEQYTPDIFSFFNDFSSYSENIEKLSSIYSSCPENSIDYAVMEKSKKIAMVTALFDWNDLGSWDALESVTEKFHNNYLINHKHDDEHSYLKDSENNIIFAPDQFVAISGVNDLIIVSTKKALMIIPKKEAQRVKEIYTFLKEKKLDELL